MNARCHGARRRRRRRRGRGPRGVRRRRIIPKIILSYREKRQNKVWRRFHEKKVEKKDLKKKCTELINSPRRLSVRGHRHEEVRYSKRGIHAHVCMYACVCVCVL